MQKLLPRIERDISPLIFHARQFLLNLIQVYQAKKEFISIYSNIGRMLWANMVNLICLLIFENWDWLVMSYMVCVQHTFDMFSWFVALFSFFDLAFYQRKMATLNFAQVSEMDYTSAPWNVLIYFEINQIA